MNKNQSCRDILENGPRPKHFHRPRCLRSPSESHRLPRLPPDAGLNGGAAGKDEVTVADCVIESSVTGHAIFVSWRVDRENV